MPDEAVRQIRWARERGAVAVFMRPCEDDRFLTDEFILSDLRRSPESRHVDLRAYRQW